MKIIKSKFCLNNVGFNLKFAVFFFNVKKSALAKGVGLSAEKVP